MFILDLYIAFCFPVFYYITLRWNCSSVFSLIQFASFYIFPVWYLEHLLTPIFTGFYFLFCSRMYLQLGLQVGS